MSQGTLFLVVGPSGVGKDTLLDGARAALTTDARFVFARRVITRAADAGGEDHEAVTSEEFSRRKQAGDFLLTWSAHGLDYGLPASLAQHLEQGRHVVANGSRATIEELAKLVANLVVIEVTAPATTVAARLRARGRESSPEIDGRLARAVPRPLSHIRVIQIANDADVATGVGRLVAALTVSHHGLGLSHAASPDSASALRAKLRGEELSESQIRTLIGDIVEGRYPEHEVAAFLVAATRGLTDDEVVALARTRFELAEKMQWDDKIVVDKHSMGGIPGSRITMILVPLVAAHGLLIPKTSSRAITSAAGTADAMETVARVDLTVAEVQRVVAQARGCVVWNGRLNHSAVDDVMNVITRPLGLDSTRWAVASILSKKLAAGSTHVIIDLPYGPQAKLKTIQEAEEAAKLFERTGEKLSLFVEAHVTQGSTPIGRGIGPALEVRDVIAVLENRPDAPATLRDKALFFASRILAWDAALGSEARARSRAEELLRSGAARVALDRIIEAQGRRDSPVLPGRVSRVVKADRSGVIAAIDTWTIAGIARAAGAPADLSAGIDIVREAACTVRPGDDLYLIHAGSEANAAIAMSLARRNSGYVIA